MFSSYGTAMIADAARSASLEDFIEKDNLVKLLQTLRQFEREEQAGPCRAPGRIDARDVLIGRRLECEELVRRAACEPSVPTRGRCLRRRLARRQNRSGRVNACSPRIFAVCYSWPVTAGSTAVDDTSGHRRDHGVGIRADHR